MEIKEEDKDKKLEKIIVLLCEEGDLSSQKDQIIKDISKKSIKENTSINTQKSQLLF
ncbi:hypothetical protein Taiwan55_05530 [Helicobacter pylori]